MHICGVSFFFFVSFFFSRVVSGTAMQHAVEAFCFEHKAPYTHGCRACG
jgi:hypothetical protein